MNTTSILGLALLTASALAACRDTESIPEATPSASTISQWRVVWTTDPQHEALVAWSTPDAGSRHAVHLDTSSHRGRLADYAHTVSSSANGPYTRKAAGDGPPLHFHHAQLTELDPSTTYWFVIESDGDISREFHFTTAPADDRPFTILAGGDSRSDPAKRRAMNTLVRTLASADASVLALLHGGDFVYDGASFELFDQWLSDHERLADDDGHILPIIPTRGNHEGRGELFDQAFGWPGGGLDKNWYACRLTPQVLLLILNTETATGGDQRSFLDETLSANSEVRWKLASYHQPAWPAVKLPSSALLNFVPLFDRHRLDLAIESDGHVLKRTVPILGRKQDPDGVVYIGEGGLGVPQRSPGAGRWFLQPPGFARSAHHVWELRILPEAIELRAILEDGTVADESRIKARGR